jgi:hypothetical protein
MRFTSFVAGSLAAVGTLLAVVGVLQSELKPFGTGMVLICGAGVFAILSLGGRRSLAARRRRNAIAGRTSRPL